MIKNKAQVTNIQISIKSKRKQFTKIVSLAIEKDKRIKKEQKNVPNVSPVSASSEDMGE